MEQQDSNCPSQLESLAPKACRINSHRSAILGSCSHILIYVCRLCQLILVSDAGDLKVASERSLELAKGTYIRGKRMLDLAA